MAAKIFLVDDQESVRLALGEMLNVFGFQTEAFESADDFLDQLPSDNQACVVADVRMPGMDGIELVRELKKRGSGFPIILISGHADVPMAVAAIKAGANEFIEKPIDDAALVAAINRGLAQMFDAQKTDKSTEALSERFAMLTPRQVEVFDRVAGGMTSPSIAADLQISVRTVESYRADVMEKMQADSIATLVRQAIRLGRITP